MGQTTTYQLPWPDLGTTADGPAAMQALATATENALKLTRGWISIRNSNVDTASAVWDDIATVTINSAPAGNYLATSILYWWAGNQNTESIYTWHTIQAQNVDIAGMPVGGFSGPSDRPLCSVIQQIYTYSGGGALSIKGRFGFAIPGVRAYAGSSISVVRSTDA